MGGRRWARWPRCDYRPRPVRLFGRRYTSWRWNVRFIHRDDTALLTIGYIGGRKSTACHANSPLLRYFEITYGLLPIRLALCRPLHLR
jgi:hypothetical protein